MTYQYPIYTSINIETNVRNPIELVEMLGISFFHVVDNSPWYYLLHDHFSTFNVKQIFFIMFHFHII